MELRINLNEIESETLINLASILGILPEDFAKIAILNEIKRADVSGLWISRFFRLEDISEFIGIPYDELEALINQFEISTLKVNDRTYINEISLARLFKELGFQEYQFAELREAIFTKRRVFYFTEEFLAIVNEIAKLKMKAPEEIIEYYCLKGLQNEGEIK